MLEYKARSTLRENSENLYFGFPVKAIIGKGNEALAFRQHNF